MIFEGEARLAAPRQEVWNKLNDISVLESCIPGCESLEAESDTRFKALIRAKVGPINAKFRSGIQLDEVIEPLSYTLRVSSTGGAAGMGEGLARVQLSEEDAYTLLSYSVELKVKGKLAQIGSRLINNTVKKLSDQFFDSFSATVNNRGGPT